MTPSSSNRNRALVVQKTPSLSSNAHTPSPRKGVVGETAGAPDFHVVGIGASAGGLLAFEKFFAGMRQEAKPRMAFVLVQHLDPDHKSILAELVRGYTQMEVVEVRDDMPVVAGRVHIIPPGQEMSLRGGRLRLREPQVARGKRHLIDLFFRSLACERGERSIAIVLSGTGEDGTSGIRAIKAEGGMVMAQSPDSTDFDGMPRSAIDTGLTDFVMDPSEMAASLIPFCAGTVSRSKGEVPEQPDAEDEASRRIFALLRAGTGHEFSQYKAGTMLRRIQRRMIVQRIESLENYARFMEKTPSEVGALFQDLLIGVTTFFRDREAFDDLENTIIPAILAAKPPETPVRIWSVGCSTGEEAYSLAILFAEHLEKTRQTRTVQIFATDIDPRAILTARAGLYPPDILENVGEERIARHFLPEPDGSGFRVGKNIRDMLVFSEQNLIKDPPFSKLDLLICRNLLIYFDPGLQQKLIPLFHYALNPGGILFLGSAETVGECGDLFDPMAGKARLFRRNGAQPVVPGAVSAIAPEGHFPSSPKTVASERKPVPKPHPSLRERTEQAMLEHVSPATALVNARGDILYLHGRTGMFLEPAPGVAGVNNIVKMARDGLQRDLAFALRKTASTGESVSCRGLRIRIGDRIHVVDIDIHPLGKSGTDPAETALFLVAMSEGQAPQIEYTTDHVGTLSLETRTTIEALTRELRTKEEHLEAANEQLETSNQELKSTNEEMQSVNEELQSSNEELETSKEELQSVNEELATVNTELQTKVTDLSRANNDMNNLLAGTGIGTIFVDRDLKVIRFTPAVTRMVNLIPGDLGRPLGHILPNLQGYEGMIDDIGEVLRTLVPKDIEVRTRDDGWFTMRILPYRTLENVVEGAVITFVDITDAKKARDLLGLAAAVRDARDAIVVQDTVGRILAWNPGAVRMYGWTESEALAMNTRDRIPVELRELAVEQMDHLCHSDTLEPCATRRLSKDSTSLEVSVISTALLDDSGRMYAISTTERPSGLHTPTKSGV